MAENSDIAVAKTVTDTPNMSVGQEPAVLPAADKEFTHTKISGRFNQYTSGYWALAVPALMVRYIGRYVLGLFSKQSQDLVVQGQKDRRANVLYASAAGIWMTGVTSYYMYRTLIDMKNIFSETLAWELGKKEDEVGLRDLWKSNNSIINRTVKNFTSRNILRYGVSSTFFARLLPWNAFKNPKADSVDLGVGMTGLYLDSDVISRKETFFEKLQNIIDLKINHTDRSGDMIMAADLISLYDRHAKDKDPKYTYLGKMDSPQWQNDQRLFGRIAELMNQTYENVSKKEVADFSVPKLIYLLGNGLIDPQKMEASLAFIEIANRSANMEQVKQLDKALKAGIPLEKATSTITSAAAEGKSMANDTNVARDTPRYTDRLANTATSHVEKVLQSNTHSNGAPMTAGM